MTGNGMGGEMEGRHIRIGSTTWMRLCPSGMMNQYLC